MIEFHDVKLKETLDVFGLNTNATIGKTLPLLSLCKMY